ncbi:DUF2969 domain-containing protein [Secundilactobacillus malefermentans]|uniref:DUF2969 domain-containing protein n=1 Tax=Secundilactobacillus malefermentans TaxID=176292 RepID=A0A4R5NS85_9LACO|nr:DUF2969 domain-containing protein [Secundilactobacillus malefermentans]KRM58003.1 hypothetical protein FD44_GL000872 [Secundilactobacillus malefermentans DSM 5705 = KCTC 3548]QEA32161.1 DUF2969 domain-containing protein [Secundilactobacillus malefermentans]TDG80005.1 hypothetical protein C5L31_000612 [Secundilactobacillus malefermentans]
MAKKNRPIEVNIEEREDGDITVTDVLIGESKIGEVRPADDRFDASLEGESPMRYKTLDEAVESLLKEYHLHHG